MEEKRFKEILNNLKEMNNGLNCIAGELCSDRIMGRSTSFAYLDLMINSLREYIDETAKIVNKELGS